MPSWEMHLKVADKIKEKLNIFDDKDKFYIGNVLPDVYSGYVIKNMSKTIDYEETHYPVKTVINLATFVLPDFEKFKNIHYDDMNDLLILGYFTHLMTDYFFNKYTYSKKYVIDDHGKILGFKTKRNEILNCSINTTIRVKHEDFSAFSDLLKINTYNFSYNSTLFDSLSKLKTFNLEVDDVQKIFNYLNSLKDKQNIKEKRSLVMFSKDELDNMLNECVDFVSSYIVKNNLIK